MSTLDPLLPSTASKTRIKINESPYMHLDDTVILNKQATAVDTLYYYPKGKVGQCYKALCHVPTKAIITLNLNDCCAGFLVFNRTERVRDECSVAFVNTTTHNKIVTVGFTSNVVPAGATVVLQDHNNSSLHSDVVTIQVDDFELTDANDAMTPAKLYHAFENKEWEHQKVSITHTLPINHVFLQKESLKIIISDTKLSIGNPR
ncbi:hypothetical protein [Pustulibacterium marinum]|nr:hypothetical protein [Pustulibacterium marinum]